MKFNNGKKPLGMSDKEFKLIKQIESETNPEKKAILEKKLIALEYVELEEAEKRLAFSEFGYKKW
jgi:hypothetical protein